MKALIILCLAAVSFDAAAMNGQYRNRAGASLAAMSATAGQSLWGWLP